MVDVILTSCQNFQTAFLVKREASFLPALLGFEVNFIWSYNPNLLITKVTASILSFLLISKSFFMATISSAIRLFLFLVFGESIESLLSLPFGTTWLVLTDECIWNGRSNVSITSSGKCLDLKIERNLKPSKNYFPDSIFTYTFTVSSSDFVGSACWNWNLVINLTGQRKGLSFVHNVLDNYK